MENNFDESGEMDSHTVPNSMTKPFILKKEGHMMVMEKMENKPCPFCGPSGDVVAGFKTTCTCGTCVETPVWNTRPIEDALRRDVESLAKDNKLLERAAEEAWAKIHDLHDQLAAREDRITGLEFALTDTRQELAARDLVWSKEVPTVFPAMYWIRDVDNFKAAFVERLDGAHEIEAEYFYEFAGPIPEPKEAK